MSDFEEKLELRSFVVCTLLGTLLGVPVGFAYAGIGGALLGVVVGGAVGALLSGVITAVGIMIADWRSTLSLVLIVATLVGIPVLIVVFWGVGK